MLKVKMTSPRCIFLLLLPAIATPCTDFTQYSHLVKIKVSEPEMFKDEAVAWCVGTLLTMKWILTGVKCAHTDNFRGGLVAIEILINKDIYDVEHAISHPRYLQDPFIFRVALLKLWKNLNPGVSSPARLPPSLSYYRKCALADIFGFGATETSNLHRNYQMDADLAMEPFKCHTKRLRRNVSDSCGLQFPLQADFADLFFFVNDSMAGVCGGDYGAPLICNGMVIGVAVDTKTCGFPGFCTVYSNIEAFTSFISFHIPELLIQYKMEPFFDKYKTGNVRYRYLDKSTGGGQSLPDSENRKN